MTTKIFLGGIILMIIVAGLIVYTNNQDGAAIEKMGEQVSFICPDDNDFIAEFAPDMSSLNVVVAGDVKYTLPNTGNETIPHRFGNEEREYTFAGEEVTVTIFEAGKSIICNQPFDPNNAPYNFGDKGEGNSEQQDAVQIVSESLQGTWQSVDDSKFRRVFLADGVVIDSYEGDTETSGTWRIFTADSGISTDFPLQPDTIYVRIVMGETPGDILNFSLSKLTPEELELIYMEGGGVLRFSAVDETK